MTISLIDTNVKSKKLHNADLLVYGTCVSSEYPEVFEEVSRGRFPLAVCLEEHHMNTVGFKIATIFKVAQPKSVAVLTVDGSPHCVQLHFAVQQAKLLTNSKAEPSQFVIEKGRLIKLSDETIRAARHLSIVNNCFEDRARP